MSYRLRLLKFKYEQVAGNLDSDANRLHWLNRRTFQTDGMIVLDNWEETLNAAAFYLSSKLLIDVVTAWFRAAETLLASVPDPNDCLYGITLAAHARLAGVDIDDPESVAKLLGLYAATQTGWNQKEADRDSATAGDTYDFILNRLEELEIGLEFMEAHDNLVTDNMLADPEVVAAGSDILRCVTENHRIDAEQHKEELDVERVQQIVEYGGYYLWAAHQAKRHGIDLDELTYFILQFDEWFDLVRKLEARDLLAPGILACLSDCEAPSKRVIRESPELIAFWRETYENIFPLSEYIHQYFAAVEHNA